MDFLKRITRHLPSKKDKTFREQVKEEKKQKYLFRDAAEKKHVSPRNNSFFKKKKQEIAKYTSFFDGSFGYIHDHIRESRALGYMG